MNDHLIKELRMIGLRLILESNAANIKPTPTATPVKLIMGILEARYLKPETIIN